MVDICPYCNQPERVEILEVWTSGEFVLETCCEGTHDAAAAYLAENPKDAVVWLKSKGLDALTARKSRRIISDEGQLLVDWNLQIVPVSFKEARDFVALHHRHCQAPRGWRFGVGIRNGFQMIGVVMVGRPVARMIDAATTVEVNRLCVRDDIPPGLVWNACSQLYAWAARESVKRGFGKIITYTLQREAGTSLKAAGWAIEHTTKPGSWSRASRTRQDKSPTCAKNRWSPVSMLQTT